MQIAIPKENRPGELRVAASPETVKKFITMGFDVIVEKGAGAGASMADAAYVEAGASLAADGAEVDYRQRLAKGKGYGQRCWLWRENECRVTAMATERHCGEV